MYEKHKACVCMAGGGVRCARAWRWTTWLAGLVRRLITVCPMENENKREET